ncbi:Methylase involved in ubiquinone/menaquinone biosynthesis-like protein [Frankia sp. AiPs1]|uniref:class I SAM-dependent methyltransferase n=1 Tax=Frankia sp. AiPa1 TaxID=573492 RepID=UPI00202B4C56|nr:class I SAM-dependent methyltransferase [Frankia sp. AiPa1]MCL9762263.1 class I SAM-dependent methyltransferase [Frankia sp. AiPa1]
MVPPGADTVLDVGCGEGMLARALRPAVAHVTGLDRDEPSIAAARAHFCTTGPSAAPAQATSTHGVGAGAHGADGGAGAGGAGAGADALGSGGGADASGGGGSGIDYVVGDVLIHPLAPGSFDMITSVAALHHMDAAAALTRMRELLRPGGVLAVVGLARVSGPRDLPYAAVGVLANRVLRVRRGQWHQPSPTVWPPPLTYRQMRVLAGELLPGCQFRRRLLFRYTLLWQRPS